MTEYSLAKKQSLIRSGDFNSDLSPQITDYAVSPVEFFFSGPVKHAKARALITLGRRKM